MTVETRRIDPAFYQLPTAEVARGLLGKRLVCRSPANRRLSGLIVEVEAYLADDDPASHSHRGPGRKNASMFKSAGTLYVYPIHARFCLNVVTEPEGRGAAVLIRALEPCEGVDWMRVNRSGSESLATGPARLCQALGVDRQFDGEDLIESDRIWIEECPLPYPASDVRIAASRRIGISQATELMLRWFVDGNRYVSGCARDHSSGRRHSQLLG